MDYHSTSLTTPCQSIRISQSNSESTRTVRGLPPYHPHPPPPPPLSEYPSNSNSTHTVRGLPLSAYVRVTLKVRVQYADYHSTTLTPLVRVSAYVRVTLTVRVQYADYHSTTLTLPCQSIRVCQSNSDSTRTVRGLPPYYPHPPCQSIRVCQSNSDSTCTCLYISLLV